MNFKEKALLHQLHPGKLATDVSTGLLSCWLFWKHKLWLGLIVGVLPSVTVSLMLVRNADLTWLKSSSAGRYMQKYITRNVEGVRLLGMAIMWVSAWRGSLAGLTLGFVIIGLAWTYPLLTRRSR